jgi:hypothetical protein
MSPTIGVKILREGVDSDGTGEMYVTVGFIAHHDTLGRVETVRSLRIPSGIEREQVLQSEGERWLRAIEVIEAEDD